MLTRNKQATMPVMKLIAETSYARGIEVLVAMLTQMT